MDLNKLEIQELSTFELVTTEGGSEWSDRFCYALGAIVQGCVIFATEGGRNAGICVR
jgi:hypothetical protein